MTNRRGMRRRDALETLSSWISDSDVCTRMMFVLGEEAPANANNPPTEELPPVRFKP